MKKYIFILAFVSISILIYFQFENPKIIFNIDENLKEKDFKILICSEDKKEILLYNQFLKPNFDDYKYGITLTLIYKDSIYNNIEYWIDPDDIEKKYTLNFALKKREDSVFCVFSTKGLKRDIDHEQSIILNKKFKTHNSELECR